MEAEIRLAGASDIPAITAIYNHAILHGTATFDIDEKSEEDRLAWLQARDERYPVYVAEASGRVVGWAALSRFSERRAYDVSAESGLYIHPDFQGRGLGRRLNALLITRARELGFHTLIARIAEGSDASRHLCETTGYEYIGRMREVGRKFDRYIDVHLYQLMLQAIVTLRSD